MKILVIGDPHFKYELPYASAFEDGRRAEWGEVKNKIIEEASKAGQIVLLGDNLNLRHNHSSVIKEFISFLKSLGDKPIHILTGNHERYGQHTALDFLQRAEVPNWHVYTEITPYVLMGEGENALVATFIPYTTPSMLEVGSKKEGEKAILDIEKIGEGDLVFAHHAVMGSKSTEFFNEIVLDRAEMEKRFAHIFAGHVHTPEKLSAKTIVTGNIFTQEIGEHSKSIWMYEDGEVTEIPLPVRGIYKLQLDKTSLPDLMHIPSNSIVKCIVTHRDTPMDMVKQALKRFDASIIVEQYPSERTKVHFEEGALDLSVENLLGLYAGAKGLPEVDLREGFELIKK